MSFGSDPVPAAAKNAFTERFNVTVADPKLFAAEPAYVPQDLVIQAKKGWIAIDWAEMYRYRELLYFLIWRDVKVRYKQSVLGVAWAVIVPVLNMLIFTVIFNVLFHLGRDMSAGGRMIPYAIFVYAALLPWQLFSNALSSGGMALVNQQHLLTKIYFPRLFLPTAAVGALLVDMAISFGVLLVLMLVYHFVPYYKFTPPLLGMLSLPLLVLLTVILGSGVAYFLSALTVTYRDFRFLIPFAVQILMWVSFVAYPAPESLAEKHPVINNLVMLNPMYGIIDAFRSAILGTPFHPMSLLIATLVSVVGCVYGMFYFRKTERRFADIA
jgi:lipopolysaccharide transport system permease protein